MIDAETWAVNMSSRLGVPEEILSDQGMHFVSECMKELLYGRSVRGPLHILRQLWTKDVEEEDVRSSYQYVLELRERQEKIWKLVHQKLEKAEGKQKYLYDRGTKTRKFEPGNQVLVFITNRSNNLNKLLMHWTRPYKVTLVHVVWTDNDSVKMWAKEKSCVNRLHQPRVDSAAEAGRGRGGGGPVIEHRLPTQKVRIRALTISLPTGWVGVSLM
ncbi:hypothetical protein EGW08_019713 [Elysia chlorotica]|uniref:Integrase catalytic domain-containing protein n=1 Tax=Elysia chlorotica TaxID=188477 RepID=A0A3S0Z9H5_ELYCH|nr:hypothetical protein EGW08_019713 [Elysia chlorotica]